eukprot:TRINITY_DN8024_c0_g1_i1.p1 TRINITY_DN8024_c0_g1~~TRINITY_DN8024_c0_g1_i1.p1  ORF type:complete len:289 (+),score=60.75 TRINITY_DN8024_c0_g1_i1:73-939(+)
MSDGEEPELVSLQRRSILRRSGSTCSSRSPTPGLRFADSPPEVLVMDCCEADRRAAEVGEAELQRALYTLGGYVTLENAAESRGHIREYAATLRRTGDEAGARQAEAAFAVLMRQLNASRGRAGRAVSAAIEALRAACVAVVVVAALLLLCCAPTPRAWAVGACAAVCGVLCGAAAGLTGLRRRRVPLASLFTAADAFAWAWAASAVWGSTAGTALAALFTAVAAKRLLSEVREEARAWGKASAAYDAVGVACCADDALQDWEERLIWMSQHLLLLWTACDAANSAAS